MCFVPKGRVLPIIPRQFGKTTRLNRSASVTSHGIPVHRGPTIRALPPFLLFSDPVLNTDLTHMNKVFKHLSVMRQTVIIEIGDYGAGKIIALSTVGNTWLLFRTQSYRAIPAVGRNTVSAETTVAVQIIKIEFINRHRKVLGNCL